MTLISSFALLGCKKELLETPKIDPRATYFKVQPEHPISIADAQAWFTAQFGKSKQVSFNPFRVSSTDAYYFHETFTIEPIWALAQQSTYRKQAPITIVPVQPIDFLEAKEQKYALIFYRDSLNQLQSQLQVYIALDSYKKVNPQEKVKDFSGIMYQVDYEGRVHHVLAAKEGHFIKEFSLGENRSNGQNTIAPRSCFGLGPSIWEELWCVLRHVFDGGGGNSSDNSDSSNGSNFTNYDLGFGYGSGTYFYFNGTGGTGGGSGGGSNNIDSQIDDTLFDVGGSQEKLNYYQGLYVLQMGFADTEFEELYYNKRLFTQVEHFFAAGRTPENIQVVRTHRDLLTQSRAYEQANIISGWKVGTIEALKKYTSSGFSIIEFAKLFSNQPAFNAADAFLTRNSFNVRSKSFVKILANSGNQMGDYTRFVKIMESCSLTEPELAIAVLALKDNVERSKYNLAVYNYFIEHDIKFNFKTNPNQSAPAAFNYADMSITFTSLATIEQGTFAEELFHGYQNHFYPGELALIATNGSLGRANIEFEAKLFYDFVNAGTYGCCIALRLDPIVSSEYLDYVLIKSNNSSNLPTNYSSFSNQYFYFMEKFVLEKPNYNYINPNKLPTALINISTRAR